MDHGPPYQQKGERTVNNPTLEELLEDWKEERISAKQALDQLLRYVQLLHEQLRALERSRPASPAPGRRRRPAGRRHAMPAPAQNGAKGTISLK
jgi:hypothetical protein